MVGKNRLVAQVYSAGTLDEEEFIRRSSAAGTMVSESDTRAVFANSKRLVVEALADGFNVSTGLGTFSVRVKGVFLGYEDRFDASRHEIAIDFRPARWLVKDLQQRARTHKIPPHEMQPNLNSFLDVVTGQRNAIMTPGGIGHISGNRLKFDPDDPEQGLYILGENRGVLRVRVIAENRPHKILFLIPPLPSGSYRLAVRAVVHGSASLETGFLADALAVTDGAALLDEGDGFVAAGPFLLGRPPADR
jgi:hypothetical protein